MFAVIKTGGKQYKVKEGDILDLELLKANREVVFSDILLISDDNKNIKIGQPRVSGAKVKASILEPEVKGEKLTIMKFKPKKRIKKKIDHQKKYTRVKIEKMEV